MRLARWEPNGLGEEGGVGGAGIMWIGSGSSGFDARAHRPIHSILPYRDRNSLRPKRLRAHPLRLLKRDSGFELFMPYKSVGVQI